MIDPELDHDEKTEPGASFPIGTEHPRKPYEAPAVRAATPEEIVRLMSGPFTSEQLDWLISGAERVSGGEELVRVYRAVLEAAKLDDTEAIDNALWALMQSVTR